MSLNSTGQAKPYKCGDCGKGCEADAQVCVACNGHYIVPKSRGRSRARPEGYKKKMDLRYDFDVGAARDNED